MAQSFRLVLKPRWAVPAVLLAVLMVWGARRAYCHLHGMADSAAHPAATTPPPAVVVTVVQPIQKPAVRAVTLPASVEAFEKATLYAKVAGYLQWIKVDKGDRVKRGQVLALIAVPEMETDHQRAKAAVLEAQAAHERAQADAALKELTFRRLESIRKSQPEVISQQEVDVARAAYQVAQADVKLASQKIALAHLDVERIEVLMEYARIKSPYDGVVTERFVDPGAMIQSATSSTGNVAPLVAVAGMDTLRVYVHVPEPDVSRVRRGDPARVRLDALPGGEFSGRIARFTGALDPQTRTMKTEIDLPNPSHAIRPGMYGTATLELGREAGAWFLPPESVRKDAEGKKFVFSAVRGRLGKVPVETGLDDGKLVQVKGLRGGEAVVLTGAENLQEGMAVKTARPAVM